MCILLEKADFLTGWGYQKMLSENVIFEKASSDNNVKSGFLVPCQKSRFLRSFSNSVRSLTVVSISHKEWPKIKIFVQDFVPIKTGVTK